MAQNFSSLVPRQKWFFERRNMKVGDVVLIQYVGKCRPATYRLGVVVGVEVDADGLVRTVTVEYSLLSELALEDRTSYKGVTKKRLRVPVQRLVLILPVEESGQVLPGVQAGDDPAPLDEVVKMSVDYSVVWNEVEKKYESVGRKIRSQRQVGDSPGQSEHVRVNVQGLDGGAAQVAEEVTGGVLQERLRVEVDDAQEAREVYEMSEDFEHYSVLMSTISCEDFEKRIYEEKSKTLNWEIVDEDEELK